MAILVAVAVFAVESNPQAAVGFDACEDFAQPRQDIFKGDRTRQREIQVF